MKKFLMFLFILVAVITAVHAGDVNNLFKRNMPIGINPSIGGIVYDVTKFGFNENLRTNQVVMNTALVDRVVGIRNMRQQIVKAGDYQYAVTGFVVDNKLGIKAFGSVNPTVGGEALLAALTKYEADGTVPSVDPSCDRIVFIAYKGKTFTLYKNVD